MKMKIDLVNLSRHATKTELQWMVGTQFPTWIQFMLQRKATGEDPGTLIDELAKICNVDEKTEVLR